MSLIIRKYGGSSVATSEKIISIAKHIKKLYLENNKIIVVVSAMGKSTNRLLDAAHKITDKPNIRELDMLLSIGERKSISLMAIALIDIGVPTISLTGSQIGLITDNSYGNAQIIEIKGDRIKQELAQNKVVVVAGYQGVSLNKEITTLGRGGTDTTAIALAARFDADRCELMKDVDGLYSVPVDFIHNAYLRKHINFKELQDYADAGLQLLSKNAMKIAYKNKVKLSIGNTYSNRIGTTLNNDDEIKTGISQIIEKDCILSDDKIQNEDLDKLITINAKLKRIYFNPISNKKNKDYIFISIFGFSLLNLPIEELLSRMNFIFSNITDEKIELLFEQKNYNIYKNDIFTNIKKYIIK